MATSEKSHALFVEDAHVSSKHNANPLTLADAAIERPSPWGIGHRKLYLFCGVVYLCSTMNGFDGSIMGSINAIPEFQSYYGLSEKGASATGLVFSIFMIGQMTGALFTWTADWGGRRMCMFGGCLGVCVGTVVTSVATNLTTFIGGRFLLSFFSTIATVAAPIYLVEIAPPLYRGTVAGMYNTLYYMGSIIATFAIYGSNIHLSGNLKWRLPLWLQMLCPGFVCLFILFAPESPRWLVATGRDEEARRILIQYHANGIDNHPMVQLEMDEIHRSLESQGLNSFRTYFDLRKLFTTKARLYRVMLAVVFAWFGQFSGNNISSYYLPVMLENVGITSTNMKLLLNAIYALTGWVAASSGARFQDIVGRRKMLIGSCIGMSICLAITTGTAAKYEADGSKAASSASIAFLFIFGVVFAFAFTSLQPMYPAEVLSNDQRAKGMMLFQITAGCASFVNTFAAPTALKNIRYWFYAFFAFWDLFECAFIYLFFVETKGRTIEELDEVFESRDPRKASLQPVLTREQRIS